MINETTFPTGTLGWDNTQIMLAKNSDKVKIDTNGWLMSEKLDGIRGVWDGKQMWSRQGKVIHVPDYFTKNFPPFPLDGELFAGRGLFQQTMSIVRQVFPDDRWKTIHYLVFDSMYDPLQPFKERLTLAQDWFKEHSNEYANVISQIPCDSQDKRDSFLNTIVEQGGEGIMIRDPDAVYTGKRSSSILKIKPIYDAEAKILGYSDGKGKYEGMVGAFKVIDEIGHEFKLSGMNDELRRNPPEVGIIVTFQYNDKTVGGVPRFARFIRVRNDYEWKGKILPPDLKPKKTTSVKDENIKNKGGKSFCFTGPMYNMSRTQMEEFTLKQGGIVRKSVSKKLDYLVTNTPQSNTSKNKKAREFEIKIITEKEFVELMGEKDES